MLSGRLERLTFALPELKHPPPIADRGKAVPTCPAPPVPVGTPEGGGFPGYSDRSDRPGLKTNGEVGKNMMPANCAHGCGRCHHSTLCAGRRSRTKNVPRSKPRREGNSARPSRKPTIGPKWRRCCAAMRRTGKHCRVRPAYRMGMQEMEAKHEQEARHEGSKTPRGRCGEGLSRF